MIHKPVKVYYRDKEKMISLIQNSGIIFQTWVYGEKEIFCFKTEPTKFYGTNIPLKTQMSEEG